MFSFLKPNLAPEGPVPFRVEVDVDRPADAVYPLVDWADARNSKLALGHRVRALDERADRFMLELEEMPGHRFDMLVSEAEPSRSYRFTTMVTPRVGRLETCEEHYQFEPIGEGRCRLTLDVIATFRSGLKMRHFEQELALMTLSCTRALAKLKLHAEQGVDAVRQLEDRLRWELI